SKLLGNPLSGSCLTLGRLTTLLAIATLSHAFLTTNILFRDKNIDYASTLVEQSSYPVLVHRLSEMIYKSRLDPSLSVLWVPRTWVVMVT
ncbi:hypothetical protein U1Q18_028334, partial [Sarracenia purpurea var. burkii]